MSLVVAERRGASGTLSLSLRFSCAQLLILNNLKDLANINERTVTMGVPFDYAPDRPEHIDAILNGLDRYNPETTAVFQDYVTQQCEDRTYDCYANLALLKL